MIIYDYKIIDLQELRNVFFIFHLNQQSFSHGVVSTHQVAKLQTQFESYNFGMLFPTSQQYSDGKVT